LCKEIPDGPEITVQALFDVAQARDDDEEGAVCRSHGLPRGIYRIAIQ